MPDPDPGPDDEDATVGHRTYEEYSYTRTVDPELRELVESYEDIVANAEPLPVVERTWRLEKPVGLLEILPPGEVLDATLGVPEEFEKSDYPEPAEIGAFLFEFERWFHYQFDGYSLYFSRFPQLPSVATRGGDALRGVLFGYEATDVAEFVLERASEFKTEPGWTR